jgi:hypothetical protein
MANGKGGSMAEKPKMSIPPEYRLRVKQRVAIVTYAVEHGSPACESAI